MGEGLLPGAKVVEPEAETGVDPPTDEELSPGDPAAEEGLSPGAREEALVAVVEAVLGEEPAAGVVAVPVVGPPVEDDTESVAMGGTGVTWVVGDWPGVEVVLMDCPGAGDAVVVLLSCRLARATMLLAREASSRWRTSAAVRSFSNMPWRNFLGE